MPKRKTPVQPPKVADPTPNEAVVVPQVTPDEVAIQSEPEAAPVVTHRVVNLGRGVTRLDY